MFLLFWSKFHTALEEVLYGLGCNTSVASRPEQRSLQQEEMALSVQASHSAINQLMALGSKPSKATYLGMLHGNEEASKQPACLCFPLQILLFFWRNNYCQEAVTLIPPKTPCGEWEKGSESLSPIAWCCQAKGLSFSEKCFPFKPQLFPYTIIWKFSVSVKTL